MRGDYRQRVQPNEIHISTFMFYIRTTNECQCFSFEIRAGTLEPNDVRGPIFLFCILAKFAPSNVLKLPVLGFVGTQCTAFPADK